jgi:IclR family KDG regulon transcriptional repressor
VALRVNAGTTLKPPTVKAATTVTKVCRIIEEFRDKKSLGISDLARRTALLPSDIHRILASLRVSGYVEQDPETRKYHLGLALLRVGLTALQRNEFREKAQPVLVRLAQQIGACVHLGLLDLQALEVMMLDQIDPSGANMFNSALGGAVPLHCSALGKSILAGLNREVADEALARCAMGRNTGRTITDATVLQKQLQQVRLQGYAVDLDECLDGASCLGSPVRDYTGTVIGAISTSMPSSRFLMFDEGQLSKRVKAAACVVSKALGSYPHQ